MTKVIFKVILCVLVIGGLFHQNDAKCINIDFDVRIEDGTIFDYTYQILDMLRVDDEEGIKRIRKLNPPTYNNYGNEISWFNSLRIWLRENADHGPEAFKFPLYPPLMIENMRDSKNYSATCGPFSVAFAGLLLSFDIPVRLIHVYRNSSDKELTSHTFNEVWSEENQKWIVQDVDHNIFWMNGEGLPVSSFEIQQEVQRCGKNLRCYHIRPYKSCDGKTISDKILWDIFHRLVISFQTNYYKVFNADYLGHQIGFLFHLRRREEIENNDPNWLNYKKSLAIKSIEDQYLLYPPLNQIEITMFDEGDRFRFCLQNNILNFDYYEVKKPPKKWEKLGHGQGCFYYRKKLCDKEMEIKIRGVSKHGHRTSSWRIIIKPILT